MQEPLRNSCSPSIFPRSVCPLCLVADLTPAQELVRYFDVSSLTGTGVEALLDAAADMGPARPLVCPTLEEVKQHLLVHVQART